MSDDSDDPVMALLATQRAVLAAIENLAGQVEAMQGKVDAMSGVLAQLIAGTVDAAVAGGADRVSSLGDRFRTATAEEAARDPVLYAAYTHYAVAQAIAKNLHRDNPILAEQEAARAREWIADQLDRGRQFDMAKTKRREDGAAHAVIESIHEEMFGGRVRVRELPER